LICAFFRECSGSSLCDLLSIALCFIDPWRLMVLESLHEVVDHVHSSLMLESLPCNLVDF
jgi:hypothetical protein